jgi:superfamily I DNA/RNA helicase
MFGPPGTGKTTRLATEIIPKAVSDFGSDKVMVTSFTRTAAKEIASRGIPVDDNMVGTLHSICFRALKSPVLYLKYLKDWNEKYPHYAILGKATGSLDEGGDTAFVYDSEGYQYTGDQLYSKVQILRAKMIDVSEWPTEAVAFHQKWSAWKKESDCLDFTDLIEICLNEKAMAPGNPRCMIVDEAQDFNKMQIELVREWGRYMNWHLLVGDDDQCVYGFSGADPKTFLYPPLEDKYKTVLQQSYRVPEAVHKKAMEISSKIKIKEEKIYAPKAEQGRIINGDGNYKLPEWAIDKAESLMKDNKTCMFIASCSYMLTDIIRQLRERGLPFHNPYRTTRGDWNPLRCDGDGISGTQLLSSFLLYHTDEAYWHIELFLDWVRYLKTGPTGLIRKHGKEQINILVDIYNEAMMEETPESLEKLESCRPWVERILSEEAILPALNRDIYWLLENVQTARVKGLQYPLAVYKKYGQDGLGYGKIGHREYKDFQPKILVGTIHSVKGGEAHSVFLYPDLSQSAYMEMDEKQENRDAVNRLFYVGVTRAADTLYIMEPASRYFVEI